MRVRDYKVYLARHLGMSFLELGQLPALDLLELVREVEYQRRLEQYPIIYRLGQLMCILSNTKTTRRKPEELVGKQPEREERRKMTKQKGAYSVILGDGESYELAILNANMMEALEDEYDKSWGELFTNARVKVMKSMLHQMLKPNYPEITIEKVGVLLNTKVMPAFGKIITDMSK
tara:strand:+ start:4454 stop:4981 length:528 start_codon:yes stop_codon:yes gene_type:complete